MGFRARTRQLTLTFLLAGLLAALTTLAKTEMGVAALAAGVTAAVLGGYPNPRRTMLLAGVFVLSAGALTAGVYGFEAARVGWSTLASESRRATPEGAGSDHRGHERGDAGATDAQEFRVC